MLSLFYRVSVALWARQYRCYLKAKQNQTITRKRPCSLSSGADKDIMLAIT